ncbi:MAG: hypothetical protein ABSF09_13440 [Candidatus Bathyarchaeia archaeon]|jgi:hypothetical protein
MEIYEWAREYAKDLGKSFGQLVEECLQDRRKSDVRDPTQKERKRVLKELVEVSKKLSTWQHRLDPDSKEFDPRINKLGMIAAALVKAYSELSEDWDLIRLQAVEYFNNDPNLGWAKELNITNVLEIDQACDQAQEIHDLKKRKEELTHANNELRIKVANKKTVSTTIATSDLQTPVENQIIESSVVEVKSSDDDSKKETSKKESKVTKEGMEALADF